MASRGMRNMAAILRDTQPPDPREHMRHYVCVTNPIVIFRVLSGKIKQKCIYIHCFISIYIYTLICKDVR